MMYLSKVRVAPEGLDPESLQKVMQGHAYGNHQLLWQLFPDQTERPFLFRQELERESRLEDQPRGLPLFYVLSTVEPQPVPGLLDCGEPKWFAPQLHAGQHLAFALRANPVVARREEGQKRSGRHDVLMDAKKAALEEGVGDPLAIQARMDEAARRWLCDAGRSENNGYQLLTEPHVSGYRQHTYRRKGGEIRFSSVDFESSLEVTDPKRFRRALAEGIGRSKAFGCGLWLVRRLRP